MVFFNIKDNILGFGHSLLGIRKHLFNQSADLYVERLNRAGLTCETAKTKHGATVYCNVCGFTMARTILIGGWSMQTCSAWNFARTVKNPSFKTWAETLSDCNRPERLEAISEASSQSKEEVPKLPVLTASNLPTSLINNILS